MKPDWDMVVIGGGPGGLSAAQYGARANLRTLVIEKLAPGGTVLLINDMENYPGFPTPVNGFDFSDKMHQQTKNFGAEIKLLSAQSVRKEGDVFVIETSDGPVTSWTVVLSTGSEHKKLDVPGELDLGGKGVSYCATCDGPFFKNKPMLVVGGGDAACDEANYLANLTDRVIMIHRRDAFRAQKSLAERVLSNPHIEVRFNHVLDRIEGTSKVEKTFLRRTDTNEVYEEDVDAVFIFIGSIPQTQLVPDLEKDEAGYIVTDQNMQTTVPGLYAVGDVRSTPFRQVVVACGEGAVAAHRASMHTDDLKNATYSGRLSA